ncbi:MAG: flagellar assembly protein FliW [Lachnospiraceae bacterium]|nr:flagellar assembly protein FliW [Lachnospiraceae bacterium]
MMITTKLFGEIEAAENKIIFFSSGIVGFPQLERFLLIHDAENEKSSISWLQSLDEPAFAMPVIDPLLLIADYNPVVEHEMLEPLGDMKPEDMLVLITITVPSDLTKMTANFKAPIIINAGSNRACQLIIEDERYEIKHPIYHLLKDKKGD